MPTPLRLVAALPLLAVFGGCGDNDDEKFTDHYAIGELNASYGAFADETNLKVFAAVITQNGFARLRGGDTIEVDVNGQRMPTRERLLEDKVHYIVEMQPPAGDTEVTITFVRGLERVVGKIKLVAAFSVKTPPPAVKNGESAELDIDPRPDLSKWPGFFGPSLTAKAQVIGPCIESGAQEIALCAIDSPAGKCTQGYPMKLDTAKLVQTPGSKGCDVGVQVRLYSGASTIEGEGALKQKFKGGGFEGHRLTDFNLKLTE